MISEQGKNGDADGSEQEPNEPQAPDQAVALTGITHPGQHDVKFGRGGDTNYHVGNSRFRHLVSQYKDQYQAASREERTSIVLEIIDKWRSQRPPGRFVTRTNPADREGSTWHDVGDEVAFKKTVKVLGEGLGEKRKKGSPAKAKHVVNTTRTAAPAMSSLPSAAETPDRTDTGILSAHNHFFQQQQTSVTCQASSVNASGTRHYIDTAVNLTGAAVTSGTLQAGPHVSSSARSREENAQQANESSSGQQFGDVLPIASTLTRVFDSSSGSSRGNSPTGN